METSANVLDSGRLELLGAEEKIDARLSWRAPAEANAYDFINSYLLREGGAHLLVETGVVAHFDRICAQIRGLLGDNPRPLRLAVTRNEPDCLSNISNLARTFGLERVFAPGIINSLDYFEDVSARHLMMSFGVPHKALRPGERVDIGPTRYLEAVATPLKMLSTTWYYEAATRALFCSDIFTDGKGQMPTERIVATPVDKKTLVEEMKQHFALRYDWLASSDTRPIARALENLFGRFEIDVLAPSRGAVIRGRAAVTQRIEALLETMRAISVA